MKNNDNKNIDKEENCVSCGQKTGYVFSTPIDRRQYYVYGAGQLCEKCYYELYIKKTGD